MTSHTLRVSNIIVAIIFIAIIITTAWYALQEIEAQTRDRSKNALQTVLLTTQEALHIWISQRKLDTAELARNDALVNLTNNLVTDKNNKRDTGKVVTSIRNLLDPRLALYGDRGFYLISPQRKNIASMHDSNIDKVNLISLQRKEYIDRAFEGVTVFIPTVRFGAEQIKNETIKKNEPTIYTAAPVKNISDEIIAVLVIQINPKRQFTRIAQLGRIAETGETYAFDEQGTLITESRFDDQLRKIGLIENESRGILSIRIADPGGNLLAGYIPQLPSSEMPLTRMAQDAIDGASGYDTSGYRDYRGVKVFGAWLWDKEMGFGLTTEIDAEEALQPLQETKKAILLIILLVIALSATFIFVNRFKTSQ